MAVFSPCKKYRYRLERLGLQPDTLDKRVLQPPHEVVMQAVRGEHDAHLVLSDWYQQNGQRTLTMCMLNPSTATADEDDPTIRRCVGFATKWGYHRLVIVNAYAWRATDPADLWLNRELGFDIIGPDNNAHIVQAIVDARATGRGEVVAAWGVQARPDRVAELRVLVGPQAWRCLGRNKDGSPVHPLYQPADRMPSLWTGIAIS